MASEVEPLRRNVPFQRLAIAKVSNELSSSIANVALPLLVLTTTGSASLAGSAVALMTASLIATQTFGGVLVDWWSPSVALRGSSGAQAIGWLLVLGATVFGDGNIAFVLVGAAIAGGASGLDGPAEHALLKVIVPSPQLGRAAAVSQGRESAASLVGGPIGGGLASLAPGVPLITQAALHITALLSTPSASRGSRGERQRANVLTEMADGYRIVAKDTGLRGIAIVSGLANLPVAGFPIVLIAYFQSVAVPPILIGIMASSFGAGMVLGALLAGPFSTRFRLGSLGIIALAAFAVGQIAIFYWYEKFWLTVVILLVSALPLPSFNAAVSAYTAVVTPADRMGRVSAASGVPGMILMPVGAFGAGVLFEAIGAPLPLALSAIAACATAVVMASIPTLRRIPRLSDLSAQ